MFRPISDAESAAVPARGGPHRTINLGPPKPPCQEARLATLQRLGLAGNSLPDPTIGPLVDLMCKVFNTQNALVAILDQERVFIKEGTGMFQRGDFPWRWSFCGWSLASHCHQDFIVPDARTDARCPRVATPGLPKWPPVSVPGVVPFKLGPFVLRLWIPAIVYGFCFRCVPWCFCTSLRARVACALVRACTHVSVCRCFSLWVRRCAVERVCVRVRLCVCS